MELLLTFQNLQESRIPINYQYYISSWLYKVLSTGDENYATFLHEQGYRVEEREVKNFKHFCFSFLQFTDWSKDNEFFYIKGPELWLRVRFHVDEALKNFVKGLFQDQMLRIKNGPNSMAIFATKSVDLVDTKAGKLPIRFRAISPIVISRKQENGNDRYLKPGEEGYEDLFMHNLVDKVKASFMQWNNSWNPADWHLKILTPPEQIKSKKITIKPDTDKIEVRGFLFDFELNAPHEAIIVGLESGFGKECGQGFGFTDILFER